MGFVTLRERPEPLEASLALGRVGAASCSTTPSRPWRMAGCSGAGGRSTSRSCSSGTTWWRAVSVPCALGGPGREELPDLGCDAVSGRPVRDGCSRTAVRPPLGSRSVVMTTLPYGATLPDGSEHLRDLVECEGSFDVAGHITGETGGHEGFEGQPVRFVSECCLRSERVLGEATHQLEIVAVHLVVHGGAGHRITDRHHPPGDVRTQRAAPRCAGEDRRSDRAPPTRPAGTRTPTAQGMIADPVPRPSTRSPHRLSSTGWTDRYLRRTWERTQ